ncbi:hypothetical protein OJAV_G00013130 [Oryzias javanicus]|uniref:Uncharacterized protein n=1 Tax=Oryzias javanicus TaxID=123683 RepID=A0A3S2Q0F4_ORYJA|nr:hypothetical protein OJAV_G00013130 [Oryzias javanicus]
MVGAFFKEASRNPTDSGGLRRPWYLRRIAPNKVHLSKADSFTKGKWGGETRRIRYERHSEASRGQKELQLRRRNSGAAGARILFHRNRGEKPPETHATYLHGRG